MRQLKIFVREHTLLAHHFGFDGDVLETHCGIRWPAEHHDTLLLAFLEDPDSESLSLKPLAERYLGEPPTEQDAVRDFVMGRVGAKDPAFRFPSGKWPNKKNFGAFIARCPGELIDPYARGDATRTEALFRHLSALVRAEPRLLGAYDRERRLTRVLVKMERRGLPMDAGRLEDDLVKYGNIKLKIEEPLLRRLKLGAKERAAVLYDYEGQDTFKWSGQGFADRLLSSGLVDRLPQTENSNDSTSAESLAEVLPPRLAKEFEVRSQVATCLQTFMRPWLAQASATGGLFFARFNQVRNSDEWGRKVGARTGRLSMTPNMQNVIRSDKDPRVPKLKRYVVPACRAVRYALLAARDVSQQELRFLAIYEDGPFKRAYLADPSMDGHQLVRDLIQATTGLALARRPVKDLNFGLIYGQGLALTAKKMGLPRDEAKRARQAHAASLPGIPDLQAELKERARAGEPVFTWGGRRYYCEKPKLVRGRWMTWEYKMLNRLIQPSAADCTKEWMLRYDETPAADDAPMLLQVHDDLMVGVRTARAERRTHEALRDSLLSIPTEIPMLSDGKSSRVSWGDMEGVRW
jgi:DNA polymerase I-like protein with 3'-5' exonuclease and polymerase domains